MSVRTANCYRSISAPKYFQDNQNLNTLAPAAETGEILTDLRRFRFRNIVEERADLDHQILNVFDAPGLAERRVRKHQLQTKPHGTISLPL